MDSKLYWIWLRLALSGDIKMMYALYTVAGSAFAVYNADSATLTEWGVGERVQKMLLQKDLRKAKDILGQCERFDLQITTIEADDFPAPLREIALPPCLLFYQGDLAGCMQGARLTITGTRHATATGESLADEFAGALSAAGFTVVCGIADGIEKAVHRAVTERDGRLIMLMPDGLLTANRKVSLLIRDILPQGAVISEHLPNEKPDYHIAYDICNRLLSGISDGTLLVQAPLKSGTSKTVNYAMEQGREVFVLPGSLRDPSFAGNNRLFREGASPITEPQEIVDFFKSRYRDTLSDVTFEDVAFEQYLESVSEKPEFSDETEELVYSKISKEGTDADTLCTLTGLDVQTVLGALVMMEMKGWIEQMPVNKYRTIV